MDYFIKFMFEVAKSYKPARDYSQRNDKELIFDFVVLLAWAREFVTKIIDRPDLEWTKVYRQATRMADNCSPTVLEKLFSLYPYEKPLKFLVWIWIEEECIYQEMRRRSRKHKNLLLIKISNPTFTFYLATLI